MSSQNSNPDSLTPQPPVVINSRRGLPGARGAQWGPWEQVPSVTSNVSAKHLAQASHSHPNISFFIIITVSFLLMYMHVFSCLLKRLEGIYKNQEKIKQPKKHKLKPTNSPSFRATEETLALRMTAGTTAWRLLLGTWDVSSGTAQWTLPYGSGTSLLLEPQRSVIF